MRKSAHERAEEFLKKAYEVQCDHDVLCHLRSEVATAMIKLRSKLKAALNYRETKKFRRQLKSKVKLFRVLSHAIGDHAKLLKDARERKPASILCKICASLKNAMERIRNAEMFFLSKFANFRDLCTQIVQNASELKNFRLIYH